MIRVIGIVITIILTLIIIIIINTNLINTLNMHYV